jgi:hypothetical protein
MHATFVVEKMKNTIDDQFTLSVSLYIYGIKELKLTDQNFYALHSREWCLFVRIKIHMDCPRIETDLRGKMPTTIRLSVVRPHLLKQSLTNLSRQYGSFHGRFVAYKTFIRRECIVRLSPAVIFARVLDILAWGPSKFWADVASSENISRYTTDLWCQNIGKHRNQRSNMRLSSSFSLPQRDIVVVPNHTYQLLCYSRLPVEYC